MVSGVNSFTVAWVDNQFASLLRPGKHVIVLAKGSNNILAILPGHSPRLPEELRSRASISAIAGT